MQKKTVTQGIKTQKISIARARMLKQKRKKFQQNKNEKWLRIIRIPQRKYASYQLRNASAVTLKASLTVLNPEKLQ